MIHTGFIDDIHDGVYEYHSNFLIVANTPAEAKGKVNKNTDFIKRKMHIDSIQQINMIDGYIIQLIKAFEDNINNKNEIIKHTGQELRNLR